MDTELNHHGILGMKWGVRRTERQLARARGKVEELEKDLEKKTGSKPVVSKTISEMSDTEIQKTLNRTRLENQLEQELNRKTGGNERSSTDNRSKPKSVYEMDDAELQQAVNRLNLERRYIELNPPKVSAGKRFVKSAVNDSILPGLREAGKEVSKSVFKDFMMKRVNSMTK